MPSKTWSRVSLEEALVLRQPNSLSRDTLESRPDVGQYNCERQNRQGMSAGRRWVWERNLEPRDAYTCAWLAIVGMEFAEGVKSSTSVALVDPWSKMMEIEIVSSGAQVE